MKKSIKEIIARKTLWFLRRVPKLNRIFFTLSNMYIDEYRYFSYDMNDNGEKALVRKLSQILTNKSVIFDVGANVGDWTSLVIDCFQNYEVHIFEISESTYQTLKTRFAGNKSITINNIALSDQGGQVEYIDFGKNSGLNSLLLNASYHKREFKVVCASAMKGDNYCKINGIDRINFLKIDTEGADYFVLKGFENTLQRNVIDIIQFEYGYTHGDAKTLMKDFFEMFEQYGYIVGHLRKIGICFKKFEYTDNDFKSGPNYIACLPQYKDILHKF